jgi:hypothetical protein
MPYQQYPQKSWQADKSRILNKIRDALACYHSRKSKFLSAFREINNIIFDENSVPLVITALKKYYQNRSLNISSAILSHDEIVELVSVHDKKPDEVVIK